MTHNRIQQAKKKSETDMIKLRRDSQGKLINQEITGVGFQTKAPTSIIQIQESHNQDQKRQSHDPVQDEDQRQEQGEANSDNRPPISKAKTTSTSKRKAHNVKAKA